MYAHSSRCLTVVRKNKLLLEYLAGRDRLRMMPEELSARFVVDSIGGRFLPGDV